MPFPRFAKPEGLCHRRRGGWAARPAVAAAGALRLGGAQGDSNTADARRRRTKIAHATAPQSARQEPNKRQPPLFVCSCIHRKRYAQPPLQLSWKGVGLENGGPGVRIPHWSVFYNMGLKRTILTCRINNTDMHVGWPIMAPKFQ